MSVQSHPTFPLAKITGPESWALLLSPVSTKKDPTPEQGTVVLCKGQWCLHQRRNGIFYFALITNPRELTSDNCVVGVDITSPKWASIVCANSLPTCGFDQVVLLRDCSPPTTAGQVPRLSMACGFPELESCFTKKLWNTPFSRLFRKLAEHFPLKNMKDLLKDFMFLRRHEMQHRLNVILKNCELCSQFMGMFEGVCQGGPGEVHRFMEALKKLLSAYDPRSATLQTLSELLEFLQECNRTVGTLLRDLNGPENADSTLMKSLQGCQCVIDALKNRLDVDAWDFAVSFVTRLLDTVVEGSYTINRAIRKMSELTIDYELSPWVFCILMTMQQPVLVSINEVAEEYNGYANIFIPRLIVNFGLDGLNLHAQVQRMILFHLSPTIF